MLAGDRLFGVDGWTACDLLLRQGYLEPISGPVGVLNRDGIRDFPDFAAVLERFRQMEFSTDPITGWKYQRTWEAAQVRSEREIGELERLRRSNIAGYNDVGK